MPPPDGDGAFSPKAWVNAALRDGGDEGSADMHLSVLITKLQIAASEVDADIQQVTAGLSTVTPKLAREIGALREQASAVRADLEGVMHEAAARASAKIKKRELELIDFFKKKGLGVVEVNRKSFQDAVLKNKPVESMKLLRADYDRIQAVK